MAPVAPAQQRLLFVALATLIACTGVEASNFAASLSMEDDLSGAAAEAVAEAAELSEQGYATVAGMHSTSAMKTYIRRAAHDLGKEVKQKSGLNGMAPYYSGERAVQSFRALKRELSAAKWLAPAAAAAPSAPSAKHAPARPKLGRLAQLLRAADVAPALPSVQEVSAASSTLLKNFSQEARRVQGEMQSSHGSLRAMLAKQKREYERSLKADNNEVSKLMAETRRLSKDLEHAKALKKDRRREAKGLQSANSIIRSALKDVSGRLEMANLFMAGSVNATADILPPDVKVLLDPVKDVEYFKAEAMEELGMIQKLETMAVSNTSLLQNATSKRGTLSLLAVGSRSLDHPVDSSSATSLVHALSKSLEHMGQNTRDGAEKLKMNYESAAEKAREQRERLIEEHRRLTVLKDRVDSKVQALDRAIVYLKGNHALLRERVSYFRNFTQKIDWGVNVTLEQAAALLNASNASAVV